MGFGNIKSDAGLSALNSFLADKSYMEGYVPSQADVAVFEAMAGPPCSDFPHALRWYNHINSYKLKFGSLPGIKKPLDSYGPAQTVTNGNSAAAEDDDDDDIDLFGSDDDEEDEEAEKLKQERLAMYAAKKNKKPAVIAKSNIVLDVKPWDDTTDMKEIEKCVRSVATDGLVWGASKLVAVGYGIKKLQITCVVEDDKVSTDFLEEEITGFEDLVQSIDIAAFNKV
uniref:Elongation factor 1-beta n=1 Tax=Phallusia mammillata TaxID=59560 RepID=A0A6F9DB11_9ASCI|nr:elongation factor 1-beta-like [Phallusia mammillata]